MCVIQLINNIKFIIEADEFNIGAFHVMLKQDFNILSSIHLAPLWYKNRNFVKGDFYQKTFTSHPPRCGYGTLLVNTLISNINLVPNLHYVYSTSWVAKNNIDSTDFITIEAVGFWDNLVGQNLAERNEEIARFRLIL